jgi:HTH-type transcriptional regulator / antitoxin HigA
MPNADEFRPNWSSAPGETIADVLRERRISLVEFARRIGQTSDDVTSLLEGRSTITIGIARKLEEVLGASVEFWMSRDFQYRQDVSRLHQVDEEWLAELPVGDMIKFGWLTPSPRPAEEMAACLRFFAVPNVSAWRRAYADIQKIVAFRTSRSFESRPAAVAAWLRQGEIVGESINCGPWSAKRFEESLLQIRSLTRQKDPGRFMPDLKNYCAQNGVAVAVVRAPNGCRASGATRFISGRKALLLLSFRYRSDDQFWFSFFHEAGHLVLHGQKGFFLEGMEGPSSTEEQEANEFAERVLIPIELRNQALNLPLNHREVLRFARRLGISPGILVGQLQHNGRIGQDQLNGLKRRLRWD